MRHVGLLRIGAVMTQICGASTAVKRAVKVASPQEMHASTSQQIADYDFPSTRAGRQHVGQPCSCRFRTAPPKRSEAIQAALHTLTGSQSGTMLFSCSRAPLPWLSCPRRQRFMSITSICKNQRQGTSICAMCSRENSAFGK